MTESESKLGQLRREIDGIDDAIHDLLMRRAALIGAVRDAKRGAAGTPYRPAREAEVLRRLAGRHAGPFPKPVVVRIWREIMAAMLGLQSPFSAAVYAPEGEHAFWDLARDHFGGSTPLTAHRSARGVINAVREGSASVGVVPVPQEGEADPWWPVLGGHPPQGPSIMARLPFAAAAGRGEIHEAFVIGAAAQEPTGADRSLLVIRASPGLSRARLGEILAGARMPALYMITRPDDDDPALAQFLVEIDGYVGADDDRLGRMLEDEESPARSIDVLGGYATPFTADELSSRRGGSGGAKR